MNKHMYLLVFYLIGHSIVSFADEPINYGYDKENNVIYAQKDRKKELLKFTEDYTGNPSYSFGFFSGTPAIIADSRSLHDSTVYATLIYNGGKLIIDCLYSDIKSKKNGTLVKEGVCDLDLSPAEKYADYIDERIKWVENDMDSTDTRLILNNKKNYLPIVIYNSVNKLVYKLYKNKEGLINDHYSILSLSKHGKCETFHGSPWVIYKKGITQIEIMDEEKSNGRLQLNKATPVAPRANECSLYPATSVIPLRSYFYDSFHKMKKSYLIKGDKVNLLSISANGKWCEVRYINNKNKVIDSIMLCSDLTI